MAHQPPTEKSVHQTWSRKRPAHTYTSVCGSLRHVKRTKIDFEQDTPTQKVLHSLTLLTRILLNLQPREILRYQSVNSRFQTIINTSRDIQKALCFPVKGTGEAPFTVNTALPYAFPTFLSYRTKACQSKESIDSRHSQTVNGQPIPEQYENASWGKMLLGIPGSSTRTHVVSTRISGPGYKFNFRNSSNDSQLSHINRTILHAIGTATVDIEMIWDFPCGVDAPWWEPYKKSWEIDVKHLRSTYKNIPRDDVVIWVVFPAKKNIG